VSTRKSLRKEAGGKLWDLQGNVFRISVSLEERLRTLLSDSTGESWKGKFLREERRPRGKTSWKKKEGLDPLRSRNGPLELQRVNAPVKERGGGGDKARKEDEDRL